MNERIKELNRQALEDDRCGMPLHEKFAELIVRECIDIANNVHMCRDGKVIAEDIKKHFGVEE